MTKIVMRNNTDNVLTIAGKTQLGQVVEYKADACYQAHIDTVSAAPPNVHRSLLQDLMAFSSSAEPNKTVFDNGITCYKDPNTVDKLALPGNLNQAYGLTLEQQWTFQKING